MVRDYFAEETCVEAQAYGWKVSGQWELSALFPERLSEFAWFEMTFLLPESSRHGPSLNGLHNCIRKSRRRRNHRLVWLEFADWQEPDSR